MLKLAVRSSKLSRQMHQRFIKDSLEILRVLKILWECWNVLEGPSKTLQRFVKDSLKWFINDSSTIHQRFIKDSSEVRRRFFEILWKWWKILWRLAEDSLKFFQDSSKILQRLDKDSLKSFQDALKLLLDSSKIHQRFIKDSLEILEAIFARFFRILRVSSKILQSFDRRNPLKSSQILWDSLKWFEASESATWRTARIPHKDPSQGSLARIPSKDCSNSLRILVGFTILPATVSGFFAGFFAKTW